MEELAKEGREAFAKMDIKISLKELSATTGVSPSQIRYWEKKGYIKSIQQQKNQSHAYTIQTLMIVLGINHFLKQGYTLSAAYEKQHAQRGVYRALRSLYSRVEKVERKDDGEVLVDLGQLADQPAKHVVAQISPDYQVQLTLKDEN